MKKSNLMIALIIVLLFLFAGCSELMTPSVEGETETSSLSLSRTVIQRADAFTSTGTAYSIEIGVLAKDADYMIALPDLWNGDLVMYTHGYTAPGVLFSETDEYQMALLVIQGFVDQGFAVAFSSYGETGWAVKEGAIRTRQLRGYFLEAYAVPDKIFLAGVSEGALIAVKLAEQNPDLFDGVLAVAGPLGGAASEFEYIINTRLMFDYFFKDDLLPIAADPTHSFFNQAATLVASFGYLEGWGVFEMPTPGIPVSMTEFVSFMAPFIGQLMMDDPAAAVQMSMVTVDGTALFPYGSMIPSPADAPAYLLWISEFSYTVATCLWYNLYGTVDLLEKTHSMIPLDNRDTAYFSTVELEVERFESRPAAVKYLEHWYKPEGGVTLPVVVLHTQRDPAVPFFHAQAYKALDTTGMVTVNPDFDLNPDLYPQAFGHVIMIDFTGGTPNVLTLETIAYLVEGFNALYYMVNSMP